MRVCTRISYLFLHWNPRVCIHIFENAYKIKVHINCQAFCTPTSYTTLRWYVYHIIQFFASKWIFAATGLWNNKNSEIFRLEAAASSASRDGFANTLLSEHPVRYQSSLGRDDTANANFFLVSVRERIKCYYGEFRTTRPLEQVQRTVLSAMNIHGADWCGLAFGRYKDFATDCASRWGRGRRWRSVDFLRRWVS